MLRQLGQGEWLRKDRRYYRLVKYWHYLVSFYLISSSKLSAFFCQASGILACCALGTAARAPLLFLGWVSTRFFRSRQQQFCFGVAEQRFYGVGYRFCGRFVGWQRR
ncbi:MAG: hypothetical protein EOO62_38515 [Hymenobacter sp.]|nr:MAG: hypothetical protein EOO62_38515 [Hymenobacter sp.]